MKKQSLIGQGSFTKAYLNADGTVKIISKCPAKECYALFSQGRPFAPEIETVELLIDDDGNSEYRMPFYEKMKAPKRQLNERSYIVYKELRSIFNNSVMLNYYRFVDKVDHSSILNEDEKESIIMLAGDVGNAIDPNDMRFEISPRNVTSDKDGNLILVDCFFSTKLLKQTNKAA